MESSPSFTQLLQGISGVGTRRLSLLHPCLSFRCGVQQERSRNLVILSRAVPWNLNIYNRQLKETDKLLEDDKEHVPNIGIFKVDDESMINDDYQ